MTQESTNALSYLGKQVNVEIDRPLGSKHPVWQHVYPINYGFVPDTMAADGEEIRSATDFQEQYFESIIIRQPR